MTILFFILASLASPAHAFDACVPDAALRYTPIVGHYGRHVLFRIEKCGLPPSYILGTYHSDDPAFYNGVPKARDLLKDASVGVFEYVQPANASELTQHYMFLPQGETLSALIGAAKFKAAVGALMLHFPTFSPEAIEHMQPWAAAVLLQYPPSKFDGVVLDERFKKLAAEAQVPSAGLETMESQFKVFSTLTQQQQIAFLSDALDYLEQSEAVAQDLEKAYSVHDLGRIEKLLPAATALTKDKALTDLMIDRLITQRNKAMGEAALPLLARGRAFIAVGALHLPGPTGMLKRFEAEGYFIEGVE